VDKQEDQMNARVNITWDGQNGDLPDPVLYDATDQEIRGWVEEAVRDGSVPGINADPDIDLKDFVVNRFPANDEIPDNKIIVRPKAPLGA